MFDEPHWLNITIAEGNDRRKKVYEGEECGSQTGLLFDLSRAQSSRFMSSVEFVPRLRSIT